MSDRTPLPTVDQFPLELESVGAEWYDLGIFLCIPTNKLDVIGEYHGRKGTRRCLIELFKCLQFRTKPVSWNDIVDALTKIHNNYLADQIRDKYIWAVSSSYPSSPLHSEKQKTGSDSQIMETDSVSETHDDKHIYVDTKMHFIDLDDDIHHNIQTTSSLSPVSSSRDTTTRSEELEDEKGRSDFQVMETGRMSEMHKDKHSEKLEDERAERNLQLQGMETGRVSEIHINVRDNNKHIYINKTISREFNKISTSFTSLVLTIKQTLQRKSVSIDDLQEVLQDQCKLEPLSTEVATFHKVFTRVRQHYCFLNYHILAYLVDMFLSNEKPLQQLLVDYTNKLEKFKDTVMMKDLMKLIKEERDLCGSYKIIELKTRDYWGAVVLNKFEKLAKLIFQNLYDCAAQIRIEDGCICVSWVIPDIDTSVVVTVSPDLLRVVGVISLKIDNKVLYEGPNEGCHILESAFLQAVELGNVRAVELLLMVGTHPSEVANMVKSNGGTPLMIASAQGQNNVVELLLKAKADPNACSNDKTRAINNQVTPLMLASQEGYNEVVELLLKAKADPNACSKDGTTAIYIASQNGHSVVVSTLLTSGADPNMTDSNRWNPLMVSSQNGHNEVVELLLKAKVNPNACNNNRATAIYIASQNGHSVVVSTLLTSGADPNRTDSNGWTPLMISSYNSQNEVVKLLLKAKVDPNACLMDGATAIYIASQNGHSAIASTLIKSGADPKMLKHDGWTPLMISSYNGHNEVVKLLLKAEVNPNACLKDGRTAIYIASGKGHSAVVSTLLTFGGNPNIEKSDGCTPLMIGSEGGHNEVVKLLLKAEVEPNACSKDGTTAIYKASQNGRSLVVSTLIIFGADLTIARQDNGWTPLMIAKAKGHTKVVKLIKSALYKSTHRTLSGSISLLSLTNVDTDTASSEEDDAKFIQSHASQHSPDCSDID